MEQVQRCDKGNSSSFECMPAEHDVLKSLIEKTSEPKIEADAVDVRE